MTRDSQVVLAKESAYWEARSQFEWLSEEGIQTVLDVIPPVDGDVLELCSGSGMFTRRIQPTYRSYTCLDLSQSLLDTLHQCLPQITPVQGNAEEPDFPPESFDQVLVFAGLHHLPDEDKAIYNAYRLLRPGGTFVAFEPNQDCWYRAPMLRMKAILRLYTEDERFLKPEIVKVSLQKSGFTGIETHFITPVYQDEHLGSFINKTLARMMQVVAALSSAPAWQSFFVIIGRK